MLSQSLIASKKINLQSSQFQHNYKKRLTDSLYSQILIPYKDSKKKQTLGNLMLNNLLFQSSLKQSKINSDYQLNQFSFRKMLQDKLQNLIHKQKTLLTKNQSISSNKYYSNPYLYTQSKQKQKTLRHINTINVNKNKQDDQQKSFGGQELNIKGVKNRKEEQKNNQLLIDIRSISNIIRELKNLNEQIEKQINIKNDHRSQIQKLENNIARKRQEINNLKKLKQYKVSQIIKYKNQKQMKSQNHNKPILLKLYKLLQNLKLKINQQLKSKLYLQQKNTLLQHQIDILICRLK